jgi:hypothetical protein
MPPHRGQDLQLSFDRAKAIFDFHDPKSPSRLGWHEPPK